MHTTGTIKSFSAKNGYGFITDVVNFGSDVFFQREMLPDEWKGAFQELQGREVSFEINNNEDGKPQARQIQPTGPPQLGSRTIGVVKSWSFDKGYGFLKVIGMETDVWFARDRLPNDAAGIQRMEGTVFSFKLSEKDGKHQAEQMQAANAGQHNNQQQMNMMQQNRMQMNNMGNMGNMGNMMGGGMGMKRPMFGGEMSMNKRAFVQKASVDRQYSGTVKSYKNNANGGYGFILSDDIPEDVVIYGKDLDETIGELEAGQTVTFSIRYGNQGKPQAYDLTMGGEKATGRKTSIKGDGDYPALTVDDLKLYTKELSAKDLGELAAYATQCLQQKLGRN